MKNDRQSMILEIISQENIETQEQLLGRLCQRGIRCTQATISRDIKQMHLIKEPVGVETMTPSPAMSARWRPSEEIFRWMTWEMGPSRITASLRPRLV